METHALHEDAGVEEVRDRVLERVSESSPRGEIVRDLMIQRWGEVGKMIDMRMSIDE